MKKTSVLVSLLLALCMLVSCALAAEYTYDPEHPYDGVMHGLFNNVAITVGEETGYATYYLTEGLQPWAQAVLILTPDGVTAEEFAASETGEQWKAVADEYKIGVTFLAPVNGSWNLTLDPAGADDGAIVNQLFFTMRSKSVKLDAPFSMDKTHCALVGYGEGGAAALLFGAEYVTDFSSIIAVDATEVPAESLATIAEQTVLPFPHNDALFSEEMNVLAKNVAAPVWFINSATDNALDYYIASAKATPADANDCAETAYVGENEAVRIWVTGKAQDAKSIYDNFAGRTNRFMGMEDGGRVAFTTDMSGENFIFHEEEINGEMRRWITYVPSCYDGSEAVPVVMSIHGYTASMQSMVEESRWWEIAEKENFIVIFPQGYVRDLPMMGNVPCAMWLGGGFSQLAQGIDPMTDVNCLNAILDKTEAEYNIDKTREYITGHSNGSMMTLSMGSASAERFAAMAPIAGFGVGSIESEALIPTWLLYGEYETSMSQLVEGGSTVSMLKVLDEHNDVDETTLTMSEQYDGQWQTGTFSNADGVPMVKFTEIKRTSHIYMPEEPQQIWYEFFVNYTRGEDGTLYYKGEPVKAGEYVADTTWYAPAPAETAGK